MSELSQESLKMIGGQESYFTGKLEAYFRAKGIDYENIPFTMGELEAAASRTGFFQIPQVLAPNEEWLIDTTLIIDYFDNKLPEPQVSPIDPAANFIALLLEDYADEWLWRPAMHYRWSYPASYELTSRWLAEHVVDPETTLEQKREEWIARQHGIFVVGDGVTEDNRGAVESSYLDTLKVLESIFQSRDYILGDRPTQADFGFMGPFFRHFFCDPHPARIMRDTAPAVHEWVARMWNIKPQGFSNASQITAISDDIQPLLEPVVEAYLSYLQVNEAAVLNEQETVSYEALDAHFTEPAKPYRLWCLDQLRKQYQLLDMEAQGSVLRTLGADASALLAKPLSGFADSIIPELPIKPTDPDRSFVDSWGRKPGEPGD